MPRKEVVIIEVNGIPKRHEDLEAVVDRHARAEAWRILYRVCCKYGFKRGIRFRELYSEVKEIILDRFSELEKFHREYFISCLLALGSNISLYSTDGELWVTYAHLITPMSAYQDFFRVMPGKGKSKFMRETARDMLQDVFKISLNEIRKAFRQKYASSLRKQALYVRKGVFVLIPEKDGIYVTTYNRILIGGHVIGGTE